MFIQRAAGAGACATRHHNGACRGGRRGSVSVPADDYVAGAALHIPHANHVGCAVARDEAAVREQHQRLGPHAPEARATVKGGQMRTPTVLHRNTAKTVHG